METSNKSLLPTFRKIAEGYGYKERGGYLAIEGFTVTHYIQFHGEQVCMEGYEFDDTLYATGIRSVSAEEFEMLIKIFLRE